MRPVKKRRKTPERTTPVLHPRKPFGAKRRIDQTFSGSELKFPEVKKKKEQAYPVLEIDLTEEETEEVSFDLGFLSQGTYEQA